MICLLFAQPIINYGMRWENWSLAKGSTASLGGLAFLPKIHRSLACIPHKSIIINNNKMPLTSWKAYT